MTDTTATPAADADVWAKLAAPFDISWVEKLPKQLRRDDRDKSRCEQGTQASADGHYCGGWHARSVHLDYIGHAGITMRLNDVVGPAGWTLEAVATTDEGLPLMARGEFWAKLTVLGVTKVDLAANFNSTQEAWGDALRRTAMRFGIGTYLWAKSEYAAELAAFREPAPGEDPAHRAQVDADNAAAFTGDPTVLDRVLANASANGYADQLVTYLGVKDDNSTLRNVLAHRREFLLEQQATVRPDTTTPPAAQAPMTCGDPRPHDRHTKTGDGRPCDGVAEAPSAPPAAQEPPAGAPAPSTPPQAPSGAPGETPQEAAYDIAREALACRDAETLRTFYRGAGELRGVDVLPVLGDDDLAAIDAPQDVPAIALGAFLIAAGKYVERHGAAIRDVAEPLPPAEDDPWEANAAAGWPEVAQAPA